MLSAESCQHKAYTKGGPLQSEYKQWATNSEWYASNCEIELRMYTTSMIVVPGKHVMSCDVMFSLL